MRYKRPILFSRCHTIHSYLVGLAFLHLMLNHTYCLVGKLLLNVIVLFPRSVFIQTNQKNNSTNNKTSYEWVIDLLMWFMWYDRTYCCFSWLHSRNSFEHVTMLIWLNQSKQHSSKLAFYSAIHMDYLLLLIWLLDIVFIFIWIEFS